ncbi:MAG: 50S ribosomal protein L22 [Saprospiraceae bacterium]|nr:50S ribosomal protein L22 [Saprospiraceae bacterium]
MEAVAKLKNCPMSARKMRMVADLIRGKNVDDALNILNFTKRAGADYMEKVILSALANWEAKNGLADADDAGLFLKTILVDDGTMLKRFRPAPHGRAHRIRKRTNHITIVVDSRNPVEEDFEEIEEVEVEEFED